MARLHFFAIRDACIIEKQGVKVSPASLGYAQAGIRAEMKRGAQGRPPLPIL